MKTYVLFALLALVGSTVIAQDGGTYRRTPCDAGNVGSSCKRNDETMGVCKQISCATMKNRWQKCYVCAAK